MTDTALVLTVEAAAAEAACAVPGVVRLQPGVWGLIQQLGRELWDRSTRHSDTSGITATVTDDSVTVDICLVANPHYPAIEVAGAVQDAVAAAVTAVTERSVGPVTVHIADLDIAALLS